jgi:phosphoenolpyruvate carboxylase
MPHTPELHEDIHLLGSLLGATLKEQAGPQFYKDVERLRSLAKTACISNKTKDYDAIQAIIAKVSDKQLLQYARAFTHFLNLANVTESTHATFALRKKQDNGLLAGELFDVTIPALLQKGISKAQLHKSLLNLDIDLVFTAHPTEVKRRTIIQKHRYIARLLRDRHTPGLTDCERHRNTENLHTLVTSAWQTDEIRRTRPTPQEESKWGLAVIESTLWDAVPRFMRQLDLASQRYCNKGIPTNATPIHFGAWMGGDRDGNPNVTHDITEEVCLLHRWMAADLFERDIHKLLHRLSMKDCSPALRKRVGKDAREPYRALLHDVRAKLHNTRAWAEARLKGHEHFDRKSIYLDNEELIAPLQLCYDSLMASKGSRIANSTLLDTLRRAHIFGLTLAKLDIRQESDRHTALMAAVTQAIGLGDYAQWPEKKRAAFLNQELQSKRPLIPHDIALESDEQEVWDTFKTIAKEPNGTFAAYVISMASTPSDVLAVQLLQQEANVKHLLRVVPLFETLDDLNNAPEAMAALFKTPGYLDEANHKQEVMIGYSDSGKDAGKLAASWAQYEAQEKLTAVAKSHSVTLTLFHGRGGSVGRGGGPVQSALHAQPPGSVDGRMRVTEQGEVIQQKYGLRDWALHNLKIYATSVLEATLNPPPAPKPAWRKLMKEMSATSVKAYRGVVRHDKNFVPYFHQVTPAAALGSLLISSRPAKRKTQGGIESLRAIPWIFAWTQMRLMLPAWLGIGKALDMAMKKGHIKTLCQMEHEWPFFYNLLDMLDMVLAKADERISHYYESALADKTVRPFGKTLRDALKHTQDTANKLVDTIQLKEERMRFREAILLRKPYADPLNFLQIEVLKRHRELPDNNTLNDALMLTIAGIAAAMKNTG